MARLIFISPYMKGGRDAARLAHRTRYFATREGVQLLKDDNAHLPVTKKQQQYIRRLLRSFPEARELPEHEDYANTPNRKTAFALIAQIHEDFIEPVDGRENYLDYVANRPGVKALGGPVGCPWQGPVAGECRGRGGAAHGECVDAGHLPLP